jgi:hypothetical protein
VDADLQEARVWLARVARRMPVGAGLLAAALVTGCGVTHLQDLNFRVDNRLHFLSPKDRSSQHLPVTIRWRVTDFTVAAPGSAPPGDAAGYFALFVDQAPIRPGQSLKAVCKADLFARGDRNCPTEAYLEGKLIYRTTADQLTMDSLPNVPGNKDREQLHTFVVVLLDTAGRRIGESAWELDLRLPRIGG